MSLNITDNSKFHSYNGEVVKVLASNKLLVALKPSNNSLVKSYHLLRLAGTQPYFDVNDCATYEYFQFEFDQAIPFLRQCVKNNIQEIEQTNENNIKEDKTSKEKPKKKKQPKLKLIEEQTRVGMDPASIKNRVTFQKGTIVINQVDVATQLIQHQIVKSHNNDNVPLKSVNAPLNSFDLNTANQQFIQNTFFTHSHDPSLQQKIFNGKIIDVSIYLQQNGMDELIFIIYCQESNSFIKAILECLQVQVIGPHFHEQLSHYLYKNYINENVTFTLNSDNNKNNNKQSIMHDKSKVREINNQLCLVLQSLHIQTQNKHNLNLNNNSMISEMLEQGLVQLIDTAFLTLPQADLLKYSSLQNSAKQSAKGIWKSPTDISQLQCKSNTVVSRHNGVVCEVLAGDTFKIYHGSYDGSIRTYVLQTVKSPQADEPFGEQAREFSRESFIGRSVVISLKAKDGYDHDQEKDKDKDKDKEKDIKELNNKNVFTTCKAQIFLQDGESINESVELILCEAGFGSLRKTLLESKYSDLKDHVQSQQFQTAIEQAKHAKRGQFSSSKIDGRATIWQTDPTLIESFFRKPLSSAIPKKSHMFVVVENVKNCVSYFVSNKQYRIKFQFTLQGIERPSHPSFLQDADAVKVLEEGDKQVYLELQQRQVQILYTGMNAQDNVTGQLFLKNGTSYAISLLEGGFAKINADVLNINAWQIFLEAQELAKQQNMGIWNENFPLIMEEASKTASSASQQNSTSPQPLSQSQDLSKIAISSFASASSNTQQLTCIRAQVTDVLSGGYFYLNDVSTMSKVDHIIQKYAPAAFCDLKPLDAIDYQQDMFCMAQSYEDDRFHRAQMISVKQRKVLFVDFGNVEIMEESRLKHYIKELFAFPSQALLCTLAFTCVPMLDDQEIYQLRIEAAEFLQSIVQDITYNCEFVISSDNKRYVVLIDEKREHKTVNEQMVENGYAIIHPNQNLLKQQESDFPFVKNLKRLQQIAQDAKIGFWSTSEEFTYDELAMKNHVADEFSYFGKQFDENKVK